MAEADRLQCHWGYYSPTRGCSDLRFQPFGVCDITSQFLPDRFRALFAQIEPDF